MIIEATTIMTKNREKVLNTVLIEPSCTNILETSGLDKEFCNFGIITSENRIDVIDHHKIWRARKQLKKNFLNRKLATKRKLMHYFLMAERQDVGERQK
jgi:hypothetical protein